MGIGFTLVTSMRSKAWILLLGVVPEVAEDRSVLNSASPGIFNEDVGAL